MTLNTYLPLMGILVTSLVGCNSEKLIPNVPDEEIGTKLPIIDSGSANAAASRIINLPPSPATQGPSTQATETTILLPFNQPEPFGDIVKTVAEDGTVTINVGNRFVKPLTVKMGCDGKLFQSHGKSADDIAVKGCGGNDKQTEAAQ